MIFYCNARKTNYISYICILLNDDPLLYVSANQITPNTIYQSAVSANQILKENQEQQFIGDIPPVVDNNQIFHVRRMQRDFNSPDSLSIVIATNEKALYQIIPATMAERGILLIFWMRRVIFSPLPSGTR